MANSYNSTHTGQEIDEGVAKSLALIIDQAFNASSTNPIANKTVTEALTAVGELLSRCITNPMTAQDDLIVGGSDGTPTRLAKGTGGQVLTVDPVSVRIGWQTPAAAGMTNPMSDYGDIIVGGNGGTPTRLPVGNAGQILATNASGTNVEWKTPSSTVYVGDISPETQSGGSLAAIGSVPTINSNYDVEWAEQTVGYNKIKTGITTSGQILVANGSGGTSFVSLASLLTSITGYDATKIQVLTNNQGTLVWAESSGGTGLNTRLNSSIPFEIQEEV